MSDSAILVTGGAGYVGSALVGLLLGRGQRVRVLDSLAVGDGCSVVSHWGRDGYEFHPGDIRDEGVRREALQGMHAVVHLAAIVGDPACSRDPELARAVNHDATSGLLLDCERAGVKRVIFASTCSNYGKLADAGAVATETWDLRPVSLYAETKVAAELDVLDSTKPGFATTCLRLATVYGVSARMRFDLTVNEFTRDALLSGRLVVYGEQFWRPYVHVRDAVRAISAVLEAPEAAVAGEVFNVGDSGQNFRKQDLVDLLLERLPETRVEYVAQTEDPRDYRVSFEKIQAALGFSVRQNVPDGIDEVLALLRSGAIADPFGAVYGN